MDVKAVTRRLTALQQKADKSKQCKMTVVFVDGHKTVTGPAGAIGLFREHGPFGAISCFEADQPGYRAAAAILTVVCHPAPDRRIENFE